jgi:methylmalonyl-CoA mutase C-terminal domain/subunit
MKPRTVRVLLGKPGLDGHSRGVKAVAHALRDAGVEVIYTGLHQTPEQLVATAIEESVDVLGLSVLSGSHLTLCRKVVEQLKTRAVSDMVVIVGGLIPAKDEPQLRNLGVDRVFPSNSRFEDIVDFVKSVRSQVDERS